MADKKNDYCSFLLSMKHVQADDLQTWVIALRNVRSGHQLIFSNLDGLIQFLQTEFGDQPVKVDIDRSGTQEVQVYSIR